MTDEPTEHEKRAVRIFCDFGQGLTPAGTGVAILDGVVLTARHVLYKDGCFAKAAALRWTHSSGQTEPFPAYMPDGCECPDLDLAVLCCDDPPNDIALFPPVQFVKKVPLLTELLGDSFPILTNGTKQGVDSEKFTLACRFIGTDNGFMKLETETQDRVSFATLRANSPEDLDKALKGSSGAGLFDKQGNLAGIFLALVSSKTTDTKAAYISSALKKFRHVLVKPSECKRINEKIERLARTIPELQGLSEMESLAALNRIKQALSERTLATSQKLACLVVARGWDSDEIQKIQSLLDDRAKVIDVHTTRFGGVECRIAGAEDRPVSWRELIADPVAEYLLVEAPDAGIIGMPQGTDFIGAIGMDLNRRLKEPFAGAPEGGQMADLMDEVLSELKARHEDKEPRYYYAARHSDMQIDARMGQVAEQFNGLVPFFRLQITQDPEYDRAILRTLLKIMNWKPSP